MQRVHLHRTRDDTVQLAQKHDETGSRNDIDSLRVEMFLELLKPFRRELHQMAVAQEQAASSESPDQVAGAVAEYRADENRNQDSFDVQGPCRARSELAMSALSPGSGAPKDSK